MKNKQVKAKVGEKSNTIGRLRAQAKVLQNIHQHENQVGKSNKNIKNTHSTHNQKSDSKGEST